jgi:HEAT repeat protein
VAALVQALARRDAAVRAAAAQTLSEVKATSLGAVLVPHIGHPLPFVRAAVLRALRELKVEASRAGAGAGTLQDPDAAVRREACR